MTDIGTIHREYPNTTKLQADLEHLQTLWRDYQHWKTYSALSIDPAIIEAGRVYQSSLRQHCQALSAYDLSKMVARGEISEGDYHITAQIKTHWEREDELLQLRSVERSPERIKDAPDHER